VGGVILTKEKMFIAEENRILIRYTLVEAHSATTLQFRPFLAFREVNSLVHQNDKINSECQPVSNGVSCCLYPGYPNLYMQFNHKAEWTFDPHWYNDIEYVKDLERGVPYTEDLWVPGYFSVPIRKGESVIFSAGTTEANPKSLAKMYEAEIAKRTPRSSFYNCLKNSAKQFYYKIDGRQYMFSGYPWGKVLGRNTYMALPGNTLAIDHPQDFIAITDTANRALTRFMETGETDPIIQGIDQPDIPLWALWSIQQYAKAVSMDDARERYTDFVARTINYILDGAHPNIFVDEATGLISSKGDDKAASWMYSQVNGRPVIPRSGYLVESNALLYNALVFGASLLEGNESQSSSRERWTAQAEKMKQPFVDTFLNDYGYLYDYVDGAYSDPSVRPNMAIAIGLDYSPLDRRQRKGVLDVVTRELLTPKGLRTLSPKSYGYRPFYLGSPQEREEAMHNGPARPWLISFYADAYIRVFGMSGVSYIDRMLIGFEDEMSRGCIGSLSQLYDGNPPFSGRGSISHAGNIAGVLRTLRMLERLNQY
jgi:predicted glycogen debranching enzyme